MTICHDYLGTDAAAMVHADELAWRHRAKHDQSVDPGPGADVPGQWRRQRTVAEELRRHVTQEKHFKPTWNTAIAIMTQSLYYKSTKSQAINLD